MNVQINWMINDKKRLKEYNKFEKAYSSKIPTKSLKTLISKIVWFPVRMYFVQLFNNSRQASICWVQNAND